MPLYEYACKDCGHVFEVIQKFSDKPIKKCEQCSGKVTKIISAPGLSFKGSGWYITDYSSKSKPPDSKEKDGKESGDTSSSDTSEKSKPDSSSGDTTKTDSSSPSKQTTAPAAASGQSSPSNKTSKAPSSSKP